MKQFSFFAVFFFTNVFLAFGGSGPGLSVTAGPEADVGYSSYDISISETGGSLRSLLEFPTDTYRGSFGLSYGLSDGSAYAAFIFTAGAGLSLTDPALKMRDHDWIAPNARPPLRFSFTESQVTMKSFAASGMVKRKIASNKRSAVYLGAGYQFEHIQQDVYGYNGWQIDILRQDASGEVFDVAGSEKALTYEIFYHRILLELSLPWRPFEGFEVTPSAGLLFVASRDTDDHVLRNKMSQGSGTGAGILAGLRAEYRFGTGPLRPFITLDLSYLRTTTDGTESQRWYADDPGTPEDETGATFGGIAHGTDLTRYRAGLSLGIEFSL